MNNTKSSYDTIVIGGGQAGLAVGYYLKQTGHDFVILDSNERIGDSWRHRWDSLRLFTPAGYDGLPGMPFPAPGHTFPTKDAMADYLETYATRFELPVQMGIRVNHLRKEGEKFVVTADGLRFEAANVVVAMANFQFPRVPSFANELAPAIVQLHSSEYRNPAQLHDGGVLIVGAGNSGAELAMEIARSHPTWLSGKYPNYVPFRVDGTVARLFLTKLVLGVLFYHVLSVNTPVGRKVRSKALHQAAPLVRVKPRDISAAGIELVPKTSGVLDGLPQLEDGRVLDIANVVWCTGYHPGFSWIELPVFAERQEPMHKRGVVASEPGLYFVGLHFLSAFASAQVNGVGRDAKHVVQNIASRSH